MTATNPSSDTKYTQTGTQDASLVSPNSERISSVRATALDMSFLNIDSEFVGVWETADGYIKHFTYKL